MPTSDVWEPTNFGHPVEFSNAYLVASDYLRPFVGPRSVIPLDIPWVYLVLATALAVVVMRRLQVAWAIVLAMIAAVWLNLIGLAFTAMAVASRYTAIAVPVALILVCFALASVFARHPRLQRVLNPDMVRPETHELALVTLVVDSLAPPPADDYWIPKRTPARGR